MVAPADQENGMKPLDELEGIAFQRAQDRTAVEAALKARELALQLADALAFKAEVIEQGRRNELRRVIGIIAERRGLRPEELVLDQGGRLVVRVLEKVPADVGAPPPARDKKAKKKPKRR